MAAEPELLLNAERDEDLRDRLADPRSEASEAAGQSHLCNL
eukprot:CAMPEP_0194502888 /NCGR_PEP_ID=MMETSP0253-20130528/27486_1 /TAXON_ID=2966 /ORGANISM="Noctiluca scintillans" /LENGTH=40 /DNA_ID= /DNA_START= /DNA_END= /DNA_ORIENTATION=